MVFDRSDLDRKSRMTGDCHVRFCERFRGEIPLYLLDFVVYFSVRAVGQTHSLTSFGFSIGWCGLAMCVAEKG